jgi:hypothetical protein
LEICRWLISVRQATLKLPRKALDLNRFFELTFRPFFVLTGMGTALAALDAFWPQWVVEKLQKITFVQEYTIIIQHWGIMVGLMGVFMIVAAFRSDWRNPILVYSALEKTFMVYLVVANIRRPYSEGFWIGAILDATVVVYTILYFGFYGFRALPSGFMSSKH